MDTIQINKALSLGKIDDHGVLPKLEQLGREPIVFEFNFGLERLPKEPGIILIRGARQYGKSTWLQQKIRDTVKQFGPGSAYYLNGDEIRGASL